jgi:hypothetical protein
MVASILNNLSPGAFQFLNFATVAGAIIIAVTAALLVSSYHKKKRKRKRRHHGHDRINPTRAELGGLPPPRPKSGSDRKGGEAPFDS